MQTNTLSGLPSGDPAFYESVGTLAPFQRLVAARRRLGILTMIVVMVSYVGFFMLVAFAHDALGTALAGCGSLAFLLMLGMFGVAWIVTWLYLYYTSHTLAPLEVKVREDILRRQSHQEVAAK